MSAASQTKIFGVKVGVDPKILVGGLFAVAVLLFFVLGRTDSGGPTSTSATPAFGAAAVNSLPNAPTRDIHQTRRRNRRTNAQIDRGTLRIRPVDATRGDIDPTLRIDMLQRLRNVPEAAPGRSLFEVGEAAPSLADIKKVNQTIVPKPLQPAGPPPPPAPVVVHANIPLKFYGFVKSARRNASNRGLFLDGDNVVLASEGEVIDGKYLVVSLTAQEARMEDTEIKQGQNLPVVPEAVPQ